MGDTPPVDRVTSIAWRVANPFSSIVAMLRRPGLAHLAVARLLGDVARMTNQTTWTFVMIARFGWGKGMVGAASLAGFGLVGPWLIVPMMGLGSVAALGGNATQTWITQACDTEEHGAVQGALTGISAIAEAGVPPVATAIFAWSLATPIPGMVLVLAGLVAAASALVLTRAPGRLAEPTDVAVGSPQQ